MAAIYTVVSDQPAAPSDAGLTVVSDPMASAQQPLGSQYTEGMGPLDLASTAYINALDQGWTGLKQVASKYLLQPLALSPESKKYWEQVYNEAAQHEAESRNRFAPVESTTSGKIGNFVGSVAPWLAAGPVGGGSAIARVGGAAALGGLQGFTQPLAPNETIIDRLKNTLLGAGGGVTGQGMGEAMGAAAKAIAPTAFSHAAPSLPPDVAQRAQAYSDVGVQPSTAQLTRNPSDWYAWQQLGKQEGAPKEAFTAQQQQTNQALGSVLPSMQADTAATPYSRAEAARLAIQAHEADAKNVASGTYEAARTAPGADAPFPAGPFFDKANDILSTFGSQLPSEVTTRLQQLQAGSRLAQGLDTPGVPIENARPFTVGAAASLYQLINDAVGKANTPAAVAGARLKGALADAGAMMPGEAGTAMKLFQDATTQWRTLKQQMGPTPIASLAGQTEAKPEALTSIVTGGKPGEIASLADLVAGSHSGSANVLHDTMLDYLQSQAVSPNGEFSGLRLGKAMDRVGPERLAAVLSPPELARLSSLRLAAEGATVTPSATGINFSNTASTLGNMARGGHAGATTGAILGSLLEHHLESALPPGAGPLVGGALGWMGEKIGARRAAANMQSILNPDMNQISFQLAGQTPGLRQPLPTLSDLTMAAIRGAGSTAALPVFGAVQ